MLTKEDQHLLISHIDDLCDQANTKMMITHSDFMTIQESSLITSYLNKQHQPYKWLGGYDGAERQMLLVLPNAITLDPRSNDYLQLIRIDPKAVKFGKHLTHRDYLGALMHLGIERKVLGDLIMDDQSCLVVCLPHMARYIEEHLTQVRHAGVTILRLDHLDDYLAKRTTKLITNTVASLRIDGVVKVCVQVSRENCVKLIQSGKVFINGAEVTKGSQSIHELDVITVRGYGKYRIIQIGNTTKKNRTFIQIEQYT